MNKQQLAAKIWSSANAMRSKIEANEYKDYILGFIFYKFLCDKEVQFLKSKDWTEEDFPDNLNESSIDTVEECRESLGYFIAYEYLFSTWINPATNFDVSNVRNALNAFERLIADRYKKLFSKIFETLQTGLSKLGDTSPAQTKAIKELFKLIKDIPMDGRQDYDVLGFIYEYLIGNFAANAGKKAGEFYTPHEVSVLMSEIIAEYLKDKEHIKIYDPTSGSGSLLINIGKAVSKHLKDKDSIEYYAQELKANTYNLTRMNLVMRGINVSNIKVRNADTLEQDWPYFEDDPNEYSMMPVDAVVSNPPYSQQWNPQDKDTDPRYADYGVAPKGKADYAFLLHDLYHVNPNGIMTIVLPHGVLFRGDAEKQIRQNLIEHNNIDTIIGLPANIFFGTGIPTIIMVLKQRQARENTDVLIIDASKGFTKEGKNNKLRACDIKKIADTVRDRVTIGKFSRVVTRDEIRQNDYNLNIPRYVDSSEKGESYDIYATMFGGIPNSELDEFAEYWHAFPTLRQTLFEAENEAYSKKRCDDFAQAIETCADITAFNERFKNAFNGFENFLYRDLINNMLTLHVNAEEKTISDDIFSRVQNIPLIDAYAAYQLLDDSWQKIATDLEIIQTEGFNAVRKIDPNMVTKKTKDGKIEEKQQGYVGRIMPFELVQENFFTAELAELETLNGKLLETQDTIETVWEEFEDDDREKLTKDDSDERDSDKLKVEQKRLKDEKFKQTAQNAGSFDEILFRLFVASDCEKAIKKKIKQLNLELLAKTMSKIETLTDDEAKELLRQKWILPLSTSLSEIPRGIIETLVAKLIALCKKYDTTMCDIETELKTNSAELSALIDQLEGSEYDMLGLKQLHTLLNGD